MLLSRVSLKERKHYCVKAFINTHEKKGTGRKNQAKDTILERNCKQEELSVVSLRLSSFLEDHLSFSCCEKKKQQQQT